RPQFNVDRLARRLHLDAVVIIAGLARGDVEGRRPWLIREGKIPVFVSQDETAAGLDSDRRLRERLAGAGHFPPDGSCVAAGSGRRRGQQDQRESANKEAERQLQDARLRSIGHVRLLAMCRVIGPHCRFPMAPLVNSSRARPRAAPLSRSGAPSPLKSAATGAIAPARGLSSPLRKCTLVLLAVV